MPEERLKALLAEIEGVVWEADAGTREFSFVSEQAVGLLGYPLADWHRPGFWAAKVHPEDGEQAAKSHASVAATKQRDTCTYRMQSAEGGTVWLRDTVSAVVEADGSVTLRGLMVDITQLKLAEAELERSNKVLRAVIDTVPTAILGVDAEGKVQTVWNAAAVQMFGWTADEVMGSGLPTVPAELADDFGRMRDQVLGGQKVRGHEAVRQRRDGSRFDASISISPLYDEHGRIVGNIAAIADITERKRAENELRVSHSLLNAVFESTPDVVFVKDLEGRALMINSAGARLFQRPVEEILGKSDRDLFPPDVARQMIEREQRIIASGVAETFEETVTVEGATHTYLTTKDVFRDAEGRVTGQLAVGREISDRKRAEEDRLSSLRFFEVMDRINRAIGGTNDPEQMMGDVLDVVLAAFDCDRSWLIYPCDPEAPTWHVLTERTRLEFPGAFATGVELPVHPDVADAFRKVRAVNEPVSFGPGGHALPVRDGERFQVKSLLCLAIYPKIDQPYLFGLHQCSHERIWSAQDKRLMKEIGRRLADALTSLHVLRDLRESERKLAEAERMARVGYWEQDLASDRLTLSDESCRILNAPPGVPIGDVPEFVRKWEEAIHPEDRERVVRAFADARAGGPPCDVEYRLFGPGGEVRVIHTHGSIRRDELGRRNLFGFMQDVTERREAEDRLRASEARFRTLVDHATDAFFLVDRDATVLDVNRQACESLGYERDELIGMRPFEFAALERSEVERIDRELDAGQVISFDTRHQRKDGTTFPVEVRLRPFWEGDHRYGVALARDVSERHRTEHELSLFRTLIDHTKDTIEVVDPESGRIIDANEQAFRIHGYSREEYLSLAVPDIDPIVGQRPWPVVMEELERLGSRVFESEHRRKDGTVFPVEVNATFIHLDRDYLIAVVRDITERKRTERALVESHTLLNAVVEGTSDAVFVKDLNGKYVMINSAGARFLGRSQEEVLGKDDFALFSAASAEASMAHDRMVLSSEEVHTFEEVGTAAGTTRTYLATKGVYRDARGQVKGVIGIARDISDLKRLEEQLRQAQKMEAIGRLAGGVAHDFNNLLTVINGYSEFVLANLPSENPNHELLTEIRKAGERGSTLTRQLLAFGRRQILHPRILDLNGILSEVCRLLKPLIGEDIELSFIPELALGMVRVDPGQFENAIINLAVNARDAMPAGGRLIIETRNVEFDEEAAAHHPEIRAGRYALVAVSDSGHGMDDATKARIFEPFFTTKGSGKGTGLGLSMVYGFVRQSGGEVEVYSELLHGTTFNVYLPLSEESPPLPRLPADLLRIPAGTETVMLVEDEDAVRRLSKLILESHGYVVLDARDGLEALRIAEQHPGTIHILVTDMVMPKMGGRELAELMTRARPELKVLLTSGYTDSASLHPEGLKPNVAFLQKPFSPMNLVRKVRTLLDSKDEPEG